MYIYSYLLLVYGLLSPCDNAIIIIIIIITPKTK